MPFNSNTYHMNKQRRLAWEYLAKAREFKALSTTDENAFLRDHYDWRYRSLAQRARFAMSSFRFWRRLSRL